MVYGPPAGFVRNKPSVYIDRDYCIGCMKCTKVCEHHAIHVENFLASIDKTKCVGCGACEKRCPYQLPIRQMLARCKQEFGA